MSGLVNPDCQSILVKKTIFSHTNFTGHIHCICRMEVVPIIEHGLVQSISYSVFPVPGFKQKLRKVHAENFIKSTTELSCECVFSSTDLSVCVLMVFVVTGVIVLFNEAKVLLSFPLQNTFPPLCIGWQVTLKRRTKNRA